MPERPNAIRLLAWRGVDPVRAEAARVQLFADHMLAHGTSTTPDYVLTYRLTTGPGWTTRALLVEVEGAGWARELALTRGVDGGWSATWAGDGVGHLALPDGGGLTGSLDCDLALCPITNSMPILRHGLLAAADRDGDGHTGQVDLIMAWVSVPDLAVHPSVQRYTATDRVYLPEGGALVRFASEGFGTTIEVDGDGLAVNYPGLAYRLPGFD